MQAHAGRLVGNDGIWILVVGEFPIVSLPPALLSPLEDRARRWTRSLVQDRALLAHEVRPARIANIVGPAPIAYASDAMLIRAPGPAARRLTDADRAAVDALRASCTPEEWQHGGSTLGEVPTFGAFDDAGRLAALAGYEVWNDHLAHIAIVSASPRRRAGFGASVARLAAQSAIAAGLVPQYRTLASNTAAMRVAEKLGFEQYGFSVYIKLVAS
jgi:RimJ/RimL family protein N-acetyltransferase